MVKQIEKFWSHPECDSVILNYTYTYVKDKIGVEIEGNPIPESLIYMLNSDTHIIATYMNSLESIKKNKKDSLFTEFNYLDGYLTSQNGIINTEYIYKDENLIESLDRYGRGRMVKRTIFKYSNLDDKIGLNAITADHNTQPLKAKSLLFQQGYWGNKSKKLISSIVVDNQTREGQVLSSVEIEYEYTFTKKGYITEIRPKYSDLSSLGRSSIFSYCKLYYNDKKH